MDIFNYDSKTKEYLSTEVADLDPIDQLPLIPANATDVVLPTVPNGSVAVFNGTDWTITVDNRGTVYDIVSKQWEGYATLGDLPANLTALVPTEFDTWDATNSVWKLDLDLVKDAKKLEITTAFNVDANAGFTTNAITMNSDLDDILRFDGGVRLAENLNLTTMDVRDINNNVHAVTTIEAKNMVNELGVNYQTILGKKWALQAQVDNATTKADVDVISWLV